MTTWPYLPGENPFDLYGVGCCLWLASFVLVGLGLVTPRPQS